MIECAPELYVVNDVNGSCIGSIKFLLGSFPCIKKFQKDTQVIDNIFDDFKIWNPVFVSFNFFESYACALCIGPEIRV